MNDKLASTGNVLRPGLDATTTTIDIETLAAAKRKPDLFALGVDLFWDDPHISRQMLKAHLDPGTDAASRKPEHIDRTVHWLIETLDLIPGSRVLDLGCGPGLYSQRLARRSLDVTGVDYSTNSLAYAREQAESAGLPIRYVYRDYRTLDYQAEYDIALMIYYDLGALSDGDRDEVLRRVHAALRPGGRFVFDVLTRSGRERARVNKGWLASRGGFWRAGPHLVLTETFNYPENHAELDQYVVVEADGSYGIYRVWSRYYELPEVTAVLERSGFTVESAWADLTGHPVGGAEDEGLSIVARKPG